MALRYPFRTIYSSSSSSSSTSNDNLDRFIPNRSAMDFGYAGYMLTEGAKGKQNPTVDVNSAYQKILAEACDIPTRILAFKNKPPTPVVIEHFPLVPRPRPSKPKRVIPERWVKMFDAPDMLDNFYLNLLDWGNTNVISLAVEDTVHLWNASNCSASELVTVDYEYGPVTSVCWAPDGRHLAVGLNNSFVQIWDIAADKLLRTLRGGHRARVGSLAWNRHILTTGGMDGKIVNNDVRERSHIVETYMGHDSEICGLKWSPSGQQLASGGKDNVVRIWDRSVVSSYLHTGCLHRFDEHEAAVRGLAWCPFQANLLASGGGQGDHCIKTWNTHTGARLNSVDTGSSVCSLLWIKNERELLSSHGYAENQLTLWKYPSMVNMAELHGHTSRVLYMIQSPDGCTVATAAADETLRLWNVFGTPAPACKPALKTHVEPFASFNHIR